MADSKKKSQLRTKQNVLESLKDLGGSIGDSIKTDLFEKTSEDFLRELIGAAPKIKRGGEIRAGESVEMSDVISGKEEENKKLRAQISLERNLSAGEKALSEKRTNELRIQLQAVMSEVEKTTIATTELTQEIKVATFSAPVEPGIYHIVFFQKILEFLQSFRKKIEQAATWLHATNKRAEKKNYWSMYKKKGSSFLLSPDHYLQRSAG